MYRILRVLLPVVVLVVGRQILVSGSSYSPPAGAPAQPRQPGWITLKFADLLQNTTGGQLTAHDMRLLSLLVFAYSFVLGLVVHIVFGDRAFGRGLNGLIALIGAAAAIFCMGFLSPEMRADGLAWMAAATIFSSFLFIGAAMALKAFIVAEAQDFATGNRTRTGQALKGLTAGGSSPSQVSQDRIQRALRRP